MKIYKDVWNFCFDISLTSKKQFSKHYFLTTYPLL